MFYCLLSIDECKFDILLGNHRCRVLQAKEEGDLAACYQHSVQKPASLMVWRCIRAYGMGSLHVLEITNAERYIKVLEQHMLPPDEIYFREGLVYFSRPMQDYHELFSSWKPISGKNGTKEEEMLHHGKHVHTQTIFKPVAI